MLRSGDIFVDDNNDRTDYFTPCAYVRDNNCGLSQLYFLLISWKLTLVLTMLTCMLHPKGNLWGTKRKRKDQRAWIRPYWRDLWVKSRIWTRNVEKWTVFVIDVNTYYTVGEVCTCNYQLYDKFDRCFDVQRIFSSARSYSSGSEVRSIGSLFSEW